MKALTLTVPSRTVSGNTNPSHRPTGLPCRALLVMYIAET